VAGLMQFDIDDVISSDEEDKIRSGKPNPDFFQKLYAEHHKFDKEHLEGAEDEASSTESEIFEEEEEEIEGEHYDNDY